MLNKRIIKMQMNSLMNWKEGIKMSSYNIVITEAAQRDLLDTFYYIAFELCEPESASQTVFPHDPYNTHRYKS